MKDMVKVSGLRKRYGAHLALDEVSFTVRQGEIFGVIGVNGAGKTTLLECIEGLRQPDGGQIELAGRAGIQLQDAALPAHIRVKEALELIARVSPREAYLTHMSHDIGLHAETEPTLPPHVHMAYDTLEIEIND